MSSDCTDVSYDIEQRIVQLSARIYSHQNLIAQYTQEKERLECILANLTSDGTDNGGGSNDGEGDNGGDDPVSSDPTPVYHNPTTHMSNDGPWQ